VFAKRTIAVVWVPIRGKETAGTWEEESETSSASGGYCEGEKAPVAAA